MATRTVLIHRTPKLPKKGREHNDSSEGFEASWGEEGAFDSVAADLILCTAVDGFSMKNGTYSRTPAEAFPQICAPAEYISLCSIGDDNLHRLQTAKMYKVKPLYIPRM